MALNARPSSLLRRLSTSAAGYSFGRAMGFVSMLVALPVVAATYGLSGLGAYAAIGSINAFLACVDTGLGSAVRTEVAESHALDGDAAVWAVLPALRRSVRNWVSICVAVAGVIALAIPWESVLGGAAVEFPGLSARLAVALFTVLYLVGVYQQSNMRVLEGIGRAGTASMYVVLGPVVVLSLTLLACAAAAPLYVTAVVPGLSPLVIGSAARVNVRRLAGRGPTLTASVRSARIRGNIALPMMAIALGYALSYSLDYWLITALLGPSETGTYAAAARPAQVMLVISTAAAPVLWTHFSRARVVDDRSAFSGSALVRISVIFVATGMVAAGFYTAGCLTLGSSLTAGLAEPPVELVAAFAIWGALIIAHQPLAMLLNTAADLRYQLVSMTLMTMVNVGLSLVLVPRVGAAGAVWASCIALSAVHIPLLALRTRAMVGAPQRG